MRYFISANDSMQFMKRIDPFVLFAFLIDEHQLSEDLQAILLVANHRGSDSENAGDVLWRCVNHIAFSDIVHAKMFISDWKNE